MCNTDTGVKEIVSNLCNNCNLIKKIHKPRIILIECKFMGIRLEFRECLSKRLAIC